MNLSFFLAQRKNPPEDRRLREGSHYRTTWLHYFHLIRLQHLHIVRALEGRRIADLLLRSRSALHQVLDDLHLV
jgi:hypothetical protein